MQSFPDLTLQDNKMGAFLECSKYKEKFLLIPAPLFKLGGGPLGVPPSMLLPKDRTIGN